MKKLSALLLSLLIPSSPLLAADLVEPAGSQLPEVPPLAAPVLPLSAEASLPAADLLQRLSAPDLSAAAAVAHVEALSALAAAAPSAVTAAQRAQIQVLRAQLPARYAADAQASRVLGAKMDRLAAALGTLREESFAEEGAGSENAARLQPNSFSPAAARLAPPAFVPRPAAPRKPNLLRRLYRRAADFLAARRPAAAPRPTGIDASAMDLSVRPQDDFYRHVNGTWLKTYQLPGDKAEYGSFDAVHEKSEAAVKALIEGAAARAKAGDPDAARIANLYASFMDADKAEALGLKPLEKDFAAIAGVHDKASLVAAFGARMKDGYGAPVALGVDVDAKDTARNIAELGQSGLGLPDRDYYFDEGPQADKIRAAYLTYLEKMLTLGGEADARAKAEKIYALEKAIAGVHWTKVETRDVEKTYNKMTVAELAALAPGFDWAAFLRAAGGEDLSAPILVDEPSFMTGFAKLFAESSVEDWKLWLKARTLSGNAPYLNKAFVDANFEYARIFTGQTEQTPRWKKGVRLVNGVVGEAVGKLYVQDHFPEQSQKRMEALVENLRAGFSERIKGLDWMSAATKERALQKLSMFSPKIGAPKKWIDYSSLELKADDLVGNLRRSDRFDHARMLAKLGRPVDRGEWHMTPQTVNAYYNPVMNEIVFPAAILQAPFFNLAADDAVNYGAIGAVIGHEMSHGFDDQGAKFDGTGMMTDWWTKEDEAAFEARTAKLVAQFDGLEPIPGVKVNGKLTLGENIGDLGGLTVAYRAYRMSLKGREAPVIDGLTGDQRFFMGWAQVWRTLQRDEALRGQVAVDPHSPAEYRVNVTVGNMPEFYRAFGVKPGDKLYRPESERVGIW